MLDAIVSIRLLGLVQYGGGLPDLEIFLSVLDFFNRKIFFCQNTYFAYFFRPCYFYFFSILGGGVGGFWKVWKIPYFSVSRSRRSRDSGSHNVCMYVCLYVCLYVCMSQTLIRFKSMNSSVNSFLEWAIRNSWKWLRF